MTYFIEAKTGQGSKGFVKEHRTATPGRFIYTLESDKNKATHVQEWDEVLYLRTNLTDGEIFPPDVELTIKEV